MNFKLIVAMSKNRGIGCNNSLPWNIKEDLVNFSKITKGNGNNAIVMGKNTWLSIRSKPLPNRDNLILSSSLKGIPNTYDSIDNLILYCKKKQYDTIWIIGGESIYKQFLDRNIIKECMITYIDKEYDCDTFFPELNNDWNLNSLSKLETKKPIEVWIHTYHNKLFS